MKDIVIFEDGKSGRGSRAQLIKRGNKRVLIKFAMYDYKSDTDKVITEWFTVFKPSWDKGRHSHNNKRKSARYYHWETNEFYCDYQQTTEFEVEFRESRGKEYCDELFGEKIMKTQTTFTQIIYTELQRMEQLIGSNTIAKRLIELGLTTDIITNTKEEN